MMNERRLSARHPLTLPVQILYGKRRFSRAQALNLSAQGMYLEVSNVILPPGTLLGLEMTCLGTDWHLDAVVVHRDNAGVGVMFREPQPAIYQGLIQGAIKAEQSESRPVQPAPGRPILSRH